ncbi:MAG: 2,3-bisphosphoglycerate-independent phosphoglycerate mutase [Alphaproteobacteria bacterium]|nr:2,3-bisphosphoglycerate-independent phosphoglycerate mutase [Alphaproteobacteria bacterium]MDP6567727.1 2,3-bisphosphoglycerate-independent phosphoglycerate mutase [Alphaproteobacteria bacterium]MDP6812729.1 2,3-bisphosphoglycerate-independent phosphoglycerate mutase [Alphaproteobacteria bacterium]
MSATSQQRPRPVVLCILDGWGHRTDGTDNAIAQAATPVYADLLAQAPHALLRTSGGEVGLPDGQMGNSEVGHQNIGAGRVVFQDLPRIDQAVADGGLAANPVLGRFIESLQAGGGACHLMGLLSPGGVHSHQAHVIALARIIAGQGVPVCLHAFLDGRDTPPRSGAGYLAQVLTELADTAGVRLATVSGRYFAMDRDKRWQRVARAYAAVAEGDGVPADDPVAAIEASYAADAGDEFVEPLVIGGYVGMAVGDGLLMANFRADRAREILGALVDPDFADFPRARPPRLAAGIGMVSYSAALDRFLPALFPPVHLRATLGEVVAEAGLAQLRIAETEKYAHVTFFLNGGEETTYPGEDRILVPSPKVATYDLQPEMSAVEVTDRLVAAIGGGRYDLIVVNYANPDMVGHTGRLAPAIRAVETVDGCLGRLRAAVAEAGGCLLITADHGNIELMRDGDQEHTAHTTNRVPAILVNGGEVTALRDGRLADLAPTVLALMGLPKPAEMTGHSLLTEATVAVAADA